LPYEIAGRPTGFIANAGTNFAIQMDNRGVLIPFALTDSMINRLQTDFSFDALDRIAAANWKELNTLEQAIRVAVQWLGRSVIALTLAEAFTQCTIAIERLLILNGEDTTVERFAERLMYLLSDKPAERAFIYKAAKRLYDIRSKVVHAGFDSVELQQLQEIESFALHALRNTLLLHGKLKDHEALRSYLHDRKVGHTEAIEVAESKTGITE
jgi:hypothetical protein